MPLRLLPLRCIVKSKGAKSKAKGSKKQREALLPLRCEVKSKGKAKGSQKQREVKSKVKAKVDIEYSVYFEGILSPLLQSKI